jgi:hypothetical protein
LRNTNIALSPFTFNSEAIITLYLESQQQTDLFQASPAFYPEAPYKLSYASSPFLGALLL